MYAVELIFFPQPLLTILYSVAWLSLVEQPSNLLNRLKTNFSSNCRNLLWVVIVLDKLDARISWRPI
jgi:hypothetical protein